MSPEGAQWVLHPVLEAHAFGTHEMTTNFSTPSKASDKTPSRVLMCFLQRDEERFSFDWHFRTLWFWVCKCAETHGSPDAQGLLLGDSLNVAAHTSWSVRRLALLYCPLNRSGVFKRSYNIFRLTGYNNSISPGVFFWWRYGLIRKNCTSESYLARQIDTSGLTLILFSFCFGGCSTSCYF